ncbi:MAG: acyl-CoA dehydrogenase C-terminal domain-containing protein [Rudaea sp.]|uniref:acyl-CoA dehydrogenase C-terminal domain-containing protein n=1 Tax=unclassified Rudaea TaxID=2627037 RepID=UPI0010F74E06|nr:MULTISPECIES: acyl-CoA dehydrogenase C-terminal domain-containing protein [unclassified Rudaea]MBN8888528.1 acyl-CoA dehydrogenase C-terminal domain-containing protein [Rudaea sp.]
MTRYAAPLADMRFVLFDLLKVEAQYARLPGGETATRDTLDAIFDEAAKFCEQVLAPLNASGDEEGCSLDKATGNVTTPKGFKEAYKQYVEGGWSSLNAPEAYGGAHLPESVGAPIKEMLDSANLSWGNFPLLSHGASEALKQHGEEWQRQVFLKPIIEGRWTGTMCLTEPHCGSDLGLLRTRAEPALNGDGADGTYRITGTKIFITAGEHDLTENIVHLVLARLPDAPAGVKGISLFIVPKMKVDREGKMGARNAVTCGAIEHKMGIKASVTCVMNFDAAEGYLIGTPNKGLNAMFTMMNTARLAVGIQGLGLIERAYQISLAYARDRLQGRSLSGPKFPDKPADPLIVHADIRRMLLTQKAFAEGTRALSYYAATLVDIVERSPDEAERKRADELLSFLIPIVKALLTEAANECTYHAVQIHGGHGYIRETGIEQFARDARITTIYEGTTGIQALDLLGRKILATQGVGLRHFLEEVGAFCAAQAGNAALAEFVGPLGKAAQEWGDLTLALGKRAMGNADEIGAAAVDYLFYSGYVALAYFWARSVAAAEASAQSADFKAAKRHTARFYFARILPRTLQHKAVIEAGTESLLAMPETLFG